MFGSETERPLMRTNVGKCKQRLESKVMAGKQKRMLVTKNELWKMNFSVVN